MAWQVGSACYDSELAAVGAVAAGNLGLAHGTASGLYSMHVAAYTATSIEYGFTPLDGGPAMPGVVVPVHLVPCGLATFDDGVVMGWAVIGAWATTWAIRWLSDVLRERW